MICYGEDLREKDYLSELDLSYLIKASKQNTTKNFFNSFFTKLSGTTMLQSQLEGKVAQEDIKRTWKEGIEAFKKVRERYLIYE